MLNGEGSKWFFVIGLLAMGAGLTAKNVISYPIKYFTPETVIFR